MNIENLKPYLANYINILSEKGDPNEKYKWYAIEHFQMNWNIDAVDFYAMFSNCFKKVSNLLYQNSWGFIDKCAENFPDETRLLFKNLFNENQDLKIRIQLFQKQSEVLLEKLKQKLNRTNLSAQQDERTISVYLSFKFPEKYFIYKGSFYRNLCQVIEEPIAKVGKKYFHYLSIANNVKSNFLIDKNILQLHKSIYPKVNFDDSNLITQNFFWVTLENSTVIENDRTKLISFLKQFDKKSLLNYYEFLDSIIELFNLKKENKKLVFNKLDNKIVFTIGQRHIWVLGKKIGYRAISPKPFSDNFSKYDGNPIAFMSDTFDFEKIISNKNSIFLAIENELNRAQKSGYSKHNDVIIEQLAFDIEYRDWIFDELLLQTQDNTLSTNTTTTMKYFPLNQILYGAPGTGKTYTTKKLAIEIVDNKEYDENDRKTILDRYDELIKLNQIQFTTFHQSMSYEDFIEGIKPENVDEQIKYEVKNGIFTKIAKKASEKIIAKDNFDEAYSKLLKEIDNADENKIVLETLIQAKEFTIYKNSKNNIKFHANTEKAYEGVIKKEILKHYLETGEALDWSSYTKSLAQYMVDKFDYKVSVSSETQKKYVLIIDEINRGNVSSIFGELITLLEEDKRKGNKEEIEVILPYSQEKFSVPNNLYIIGTMNTADRSVEALDTALRRRFSFVEMPSKPEKLTDITLQDAQEINLMQLLNKINQRIESLIDKDHQIGHSFFINLKNLDELKTTFKNKIIPLLEEYFFGDFGKIGLVLGENFISIKNENNNSGILAKFSAYEDIDFITGKKIYQIKNCEELEIEDFISIYE